MDKVADVPCKVLAEPVWRARRERHEHRVDAWVRPHLERRRERQSHPVEDFLFTYYAQRPAALRRWHPGFGRALAGASSYRGLKGYVEVSASSTAEGSTAERSTAEGSTSRGTGVTVAKEYVDSQRPLLTSLRTLLTATANRPAQLGCFGMHEWSMVYRLDQADVRHASWPLRLGAAGTDEVVASHRIACSHFDAFRFFTPPARPLNTLRPASDDRAAFEQPGCLHAGMDLYKHAFRLSPMVCSDLVADCFELARDIRVLDMRASPYDLSALGYSPVRVETAQGKQEYAAAQRAFAERAAPLRQRLIKGVRPSAAGLNDHTDRHSGRPERDSAPEVRARVPRVPVPVAAHPRQVPYQQAGDRSCQGAAASTCADRASSRWSSPGRPASITPTGRPSAVMCRGNETAGMPVRFQAEV